MPILIGYASNKVAKVCLEAKAARKSLPQNVATLLPQRLAEIAAFASLAAIPPGAPLHFHALSENWTGHYAVSIDKRFRIVFRPAGKFDTPTEGMPDLATVTEIIVASVENYHD
jgi:plasmid maintenance system killer protein